MTKDKWIYVIVDACQRAGTYQECFMSAIETLGGILERRDEAENSYDNTGRRIVVEKVDARGNSSMMPNPALRVLNQLDHEALAYWRDLGLTPAGLKKINEAAMKEKSADPLAEALKDLG